jgi:hypothetical protein
LKNTSYNVVQLVCLHMYLIFIFLWDRCLRQGLLFRRPFKGGRLYAKHICRSFFGIMMRKRTVGLNASLQYAFHPGAVVSHTPIPIISSRRVCMCCGAHGLRIHTEWQSITTSAHPAGAWLIDISRPLVPSHTRACPTAIQDVPLGNDYFWHWTVPHDVYALHNVYSAMHSFLSLSARKRTHTYTHSHHAHTPPRCQVGLHHMTTCPRLAPDSFIIHTHEVLYCQIDRHGRTLRQRTRIA